MEVIFNGHTVFAINSAALVIVVITIAIVIFFGNTIKQEEPLAQDFIALSKKLLEESEPEMENPLEEQGVD